jgi:hypothetical protein
VIWKIRRFGMCDVRCGISNCGIRILDIGCEFGRDGLFVPPKADPWSVLEDAKCRELKAQGARLKAKA